MVREEHAVRRLAAYDTFGHLTVLGHSTSKACSGDNYGRDPARLASKEDVTIFGVEFSSDHEKTPLHPPTTKSTSLCFSGRFSCLSPCIAGPSQELITIVDRQSTLT